MKRISFLLVALALCAPPALRAQDAATEERLNKLSGRIDDLAAVQESLKKQLDGLAKDLESVREQAGKPNASYARQEDLNHLGEAVKVVDRKRLDDAEKIHTELLKLRKVLEAPLSPPKKSPATTPKDNPVRPNPNASDKGFEYKIKSGDTLEAVAQAYRDQNIKVTAAQILNANPGLKAERLKVGQTIFIPAPQP
jgi:LysM repeat protein